MSVNRESQIVTVFGGGGFIGRHVVEALCKAGVRVRVAERFPKRAWYLQPLGSVGQISVVAADLTRPATVERAVAGAHAVINLVGVFKGDLDAIHVAGAGRAAAAARDAGARAFVHVSALGCAADSASDYGRTKALGEEAVRREFAGATILRPSVVFGPQDQFTNRFAGLARLPVLPVIAPKTRFQPVHVADLGKAIAKAAVDPASFAGQTFEIAGPDIFTMRELNEKIAQWAGLNPAIVDVPAPIAEGMSMLGFLPGAPLTRDQWIMLQKDNVATGTQPGLDAFGIAATPLAASAPVWLERFRPGGRFGLSAA